MPEHSSEFSTSAAPEARQLDLLDLAVSRSSAIFYIAAFDGDRAVRFVSSNVGAVTGHQAADFLEQPAFGPRHIHPEDLAGYESAVASLKEQGAVTLEYRFAMASGEYCWFRDDLRLIERSGEPDEFVGCMFDVTAEKEAQFRLEDAEQDRRRLARLLEDTVERLPNGFVIYDADDRLVIANRALAVVQAGGLDPSELIGLSQEEVIWRVLPKISSFDGQAVAQTRPVAKELAERLKAMDNESVEIGLKDGSWRLLVCHSTSDGGRVVISTDVTKLKDAEASFRKSEEQFRKIVESHPLPVLMIDINSGEILYESPSAAEMLGHDWPSEHCHNMIEHYDDPHVRQGLVEKSRETDGLRDQEIRIKRSDGTPLWVSANERLIKYQGRDVSITILTDLTDRKQREEELTEARETLEDAIESLSDGFALYDADDRLVTCNTQFKGFLGEHQDLLVPGTPWIDIARSLGERGVFAGAVGRVEDWLEGRAAKRSGLTNEEFQLSDGRWFEYSHRQTRQGGLVTTWREITDRKHMEEKLKESEELIRRVVEDCPVPIIMTRADDGKILYESPASRAIFSGPQGSSMGWVKSRFANLDDRTVYLSRLRATGSVDEYEIEFRRADGSTYLGAVSARLIEYRGEEVIVSTTVDLAERNKRENELRHARETLEDAIEALNEGFVLFDADDRLVICNSRFRELNKPHEDIFVPGIGWRDALLARVDKGLFPDAIGRVDDWLAERTRIRGRDEIDELNLADGKWVHISHRRTRQGGAVHIWRDVTERRRMEQALREGEARVRSVLEACPLPLRMWNPATGQVIFESPSSRVMLGRDATKQGPKDRLEVYVDPTNRDRYLARLYETRSVDNFEMELRRADGAAFCAAVSARLIEYDGEEVIVSVIQDLTEQKQRQKELREARETLEDAIESLSEGFVLYDADDRLVLCNSQYRAFHADSEDLLVPGAHWRDVTRARGERGLFSEASGNIDEWLEGQMAQRGIASHEEFPFSTGRWYEYSHRPTREGGFVSTWRDITDRKKMEQSLRDSEALVRQVLEASPAPISMVRLSDGKIIYESPAALKMFGEDPATSSETTGESWVDPGQRDRMVAEIKKHGRVDDVEVCLRRRDGSTFWAALSGQLIEFQGEAVAVSTVYDLTERKQREAELRQAREVLEDAIESLPDGFVLFGADDRMILCNAHFREMNEPSADILEPGVKWLDFVRTGAERGQYLDARGRLEQWVEERKRYHSLGTGQKGGTEFQQHDGRWYHAFSQTTRQGGFVGIRIDVTERKKMEQSLRDSEELVRHVLEACPVPITMTRIDDGVIIYESPAASTLLKYDEPQEGKSIKTRWVNEDARLAFLKQLKRTRAIDGMEIRYRRANGEEFWCALSSRLIEYRGEDVIVSNLFDLTERRESEAELARQREMLHQSEKLSALGELLAGVSHELNNPLSVLVGQALLLREIAPDDKIAARAEKISNAANRCARIVKTFLAMARQEPSETSPVDLNTVIETALEVTGYSLRTSSIEVSLEQAEDLPMVMADHDQMRQVMINLIVNAQHALQDMEGPRKLRISTAYRKQNHQIVIKIKDNGPGIPAEIRSRIFEPLYTTKEVGTGTGIGLALCHRIIEAHGGSIVVESAPGEGAAFAIRLPLTHMTEGRSADASADTTPTAQYRILVVDDEPDVGQIISDVLKSDGHSVDLAESGQNALERIKDNDYDVILSDIRMPRMDGPSLFRVLSDTKPEQLAGLAFITGDTLSPNVKDFLDTTDRPYLEKPITPNDIRDLVALLIRQQQS